MGAGADDEIQSCKTETESATFGREHDSNPQRASEAPKGHKFTQSKQPAVCFVCIDSGHRHYLADCKRFKQLNSRQKRQTFIDAQRCLNCLGVGHTARNCYCRSKCRVCGLNYRNKHCGGLHECYASFNTADLGAAEGEKLVSTPAPRISAGGQLDSGFKPAVRKVEENSSFASKGVVLRRTSAVKVVNPSSGQSALVYAQHDTASQATLISDNLKNAFGLKTINSPVTIQTLADQTAPSAAFLNLSWFTIPFKNFIEPATPFPTLLFKRLKITVPQKTLQRYIILNHCSILHLFVRG